MQKGAADTCGARFAKSRPDKNATKNLRPMIRSLRKQDKNEVTLDWRIFRRHQSRVTSLLSWYLTSLVNLSFYGFIRHPLEHSALLFSFRFSLRLDGWMRYGSCFLPKAHRVFRDASPDFFRRRFRRFLRPFCQFSSVTFSFLIFDSLKRDTCMNLISFFQIVGPNASSSDSSLIDWVLREWICTSGITLSDYKIAQEFGFDKSQYYTKHTEIPCTNKRNQISFPINHWRLEVAVL